MDLRIEAHQSQTLHLTPALQTGIAIMAMSAPELQGFIEGALAENPFLEEVAGPTIGSAGGAASSPEPRRPSGFAPTAAAAEGERPGPDEYLDTLPQREASLEETLYRQLALELRDRRDLLIAERILARLDARGYLVADTALIAAETGTSPSRVERILWKLLTGCTPAGIGARSLPERLIAQLTAAGDDDRVALQVIGGHLEELAAGRFESLAKALGTTPDRIKGVFDRIRRLDPNPANIAGSNRHQIIAEAQVIRREGGWNVRLKEGLCSRISVDPVLAGSARDARQLRPLLRDAEQVVRAVDLRRTSLLAVAGAAVDAQSPFFSSGPAAMRPLTMADAADAAGVSEATVSRIAQHAYLETPRGCVPLRSLFVSEVGDGGSSASVKAAMQALIAGEDKARPLSDAQIAEALGAQGMAVSRRTVNKYRTALNIPACSKRKAY